MVFDPQIWSVYQFRGVVTQTAGGGGDLVITISAGKGSAMILLYGIIGPDDYAANRTIRASINDSADRSIGTLFKAAALDNASVPLFWNIDSAVEASDTIIKNSDLWIVAGSDTLRIAAQSLVQNETLTFNFRALVFGKKPTVSVALSGGTPSLATTNDRMAF